MDARLNFDSASLIMKAIAAALAAIGVLPVIVNLFKSRGAPMQGLVAAERACAPHAYV